MTASTPNLSVQPRRPHGATTEDVILEVAAKKFAEDGYAGTSMRRLAETVGIQAPSLYNHFPSKEDLLWAIVERAYQQADVELDRALLGIENPRNELAVFVGTHVRNHAENRYAARVINSQLRTLSEERYEQVVDFRDRYESRLLKVLAAGIDQGVFFVSNVRLTAYAILQMGKVAEWYDPDGPHDVDELCRHYQEFARRITECREPSEADNSRKGIALGGSR